MDTVYILQVITICITALTVVINVLVTSITNRQKNYNEIITESRLEFMQNNRNNAANFTAEAKNIILKLNCGKNEIDVKDLYTAFERICLALKPYNAIDKEITDAGRHVVNLIERSVIKNRPDGELTAAVNEFEKLFNIYDDADWKFIKQQFNTTKKKSEDFDKICNDIKAKY